MEKVKIEKDAHNAEDADMNRFHILKSMKILLYALNANLLTGTNLEKISIEST